MNVAQVKRWIGTVSGECDSAREALDSGDSLMALEALANAVLSIRKAQIEIARGTHLQRYYQQKVEG